MESKSATTTPLMRSASGWWGGYSVEELHRLLYLHRIDPFGVAFIELTLMCMMYYLSPRRRDSSKFNLSAGTSAEGSSEAVLATAGLAVCSSFPLIYNIFKLPLSEKKLDEQSWATMKYAGRFAYLTRWLITLQLLYFVTSFIAELQGGWIREAIYATATPTASFAAFVSIQFYVLVASHPKYIEVCKTWTPRGFDVKFIGHVVHAPAIVLALVDLFLVKDSSLLLATRASTLQHVTVVASFAVLYISFMVVNYWATSAWPYPIMNNLDTVLKFLMFALMQMFVLLGFLAMISILQWVGNK